MSNVITGKRVAILATDGFEQVELTEPLKRLKAAGAEVDVIAPAAGTIQGMNHQDKGEKIKVDLTFDQAEAENYDCLVLPGGVANPDVLRTNRDAVDFVEYFNQTGKIVAAICHGPWTLIEADMVRGRTITSWPSLKTDLRNAGAAWVDQEVVVDGTLISSRKPDDLEAFCNAIIEALEQQKESTLAAE